MRPRTIFTLVGSAGVLALGGLLLLPRSAPPEPIAAPSGVLTLAPAAAVETPLSTIVPLPRMLEPEVAAAHPLRAVFPEIDLPVLDWRRFAPETLVIQIDPDLRVPLRISQVNEGDRRTTLTARIDPAHDEDSLLKGSFLVGTANAADRWDAVLVVAGIEYRVTVRGEEVQVEEVPALSFPCLAATAAPELAAESENGVPGAVVANAEAETLVEVLFLYNQQALAARNNDALAIDADSANYIAASNALLVNSGITSFAWQYLGAVAAPEYTSTENLSDDLDAMRGSGAIAAFVRTQQDIYGADQVMLLAGGVKRDSVGTAWLGGSTGHGVTNYPNPTFSNGTLSSSLTSFFTVCHELGHNFGCTHQREDPGTDAVNGDGKYNYGYIVDGLPGPTGTVMAVHQDPVFILRIPYFSNPDIQHEGHPVGIRADQPRAAHNARTMEENAGRMASLQAAATAPVITRQPRSATVAPGQTATLLVNATGGGLTYQWHKDGVDIPEQSALFFIRNATTANAGSYTVTVSNRLGSVTSEPAVITIATPPPPTASSSSGGSSGGGDSGGGAMDGAAATALLLVLLARWAGTRPRIRKPAPRLQDCS